MVSGASARPSGARPEVPAKMTSSILPPRSSLAPCSPITQLSASTTLDLPDPFGPTTHVIPGSNRRVVADAKDLKPLSVRLFRCMADKSTGDRSPFDESVQAPARGGGPVDHRVHPSRGAGPAQQGQQCGQRIGRALGDHHDTAVGPLGGAAPQPKLEGAR